MKRNESKDDVSDTPIKKLCGDIEMANKRINNAAEEFDKAIRAKDALLTQICEGLNAERKALEADRKAFELSAQHINESVSPTRIKLDVSGRVFSVTPEMMQRFPLSYFGRLFSGRWGDKKTEDGAYFINRSSRYFDYIVDFLRDGEFNATLSEEDRDALYKEAEYYQLKEYMIVPTTKEPWEWNGGLRAHKNDDSLYTYSRSGLGWSSGVHEWTLRIDGSTKVRIGICLVDMHIHNNLNNVWELEPKKRKVWTADRTWLDYDLRGNGIKDGSLISVRLDMDKRTLTYGVDGNWCDIIAGIKPNTWFPCVALTYGSTVTIIQ